MYALMISAFLAVLSGLDTPDRESAIETLAASGDFARVSAAVYDADWRAREGLIEALSLMGEPAVPALSNLVRRHPRVDAQRLAVRGLGRAGGLAARDSALVFASGAHRDLAAEALGLLGDESAAAALRTLLSDTWPDARRRAAVALSRVSGKGAGIWLVRLLSDPHHGVRFAVADALIDLESPDLVAAHFDALSPSGKYLAIRVISRLGDEEWVAKRLTESDWALRAAAAESLQNPAFRRALEMAQKRERHPVVVNRIRIALDRMR